MSVTEPNDRPDVDRSKAYERYNLLVWLRRAAPDSAVTLQQFEAIQAAHPDFSEREHPDLSSWSGGVHYGQAISPFTQEALLQSPAAEQLQSLVTYDSPGDAFEGPSREGLLFVVRDAIKESFPWGWDLANALVQWGGPDRGLWAAVVGAWASSDLTAEQWAQLLPFVHSLPIIERAADRPIADLLEHAVVESSNAPDALLGVVLDVAERLVARVDLEDGLVPDRERDWLLLAINHPAGRAMTAWLRALGRVRVVGGDAWTGLPPKERGRLDRVLGTEGVSADRARTMIASQAHFLFGLDPDWWRVAVLPLFDWRVNPARAVQAWSGYLQWGRWNDALFAEMRPFYEQTYSRVTNEAPDLRDQLSTRLAGVAIYAADDPWHGGWLEGFIAQADAEVRAAWADRLGRILRELEAEAIERLWRRWLADFWSDRLTGVPRALSEGERQAMAEWLPSLESVIADAVGLIERMIVPLPEHPLIFFQLEQSGIAARQPTAVARYVRHLLIGAAKLPNWHCSNVDTLVRVFAAARVEPRILVDICEAMGRLGCPTGTELRDLVQGQQAAGN